MARDLSGALTVEQIAEIGQKFSDAEFSSRCAMVLADDANKLGAPIPAVWDGPEVDLGVAQWAYEHESEAGSGTDALPGSPLLYLPLRAPMRIRGVLVLAARNPRRVFSPEQRRLLDTFARLVAISLERVHYVDVASHTTLEMESERLRNSLLSAISHDLRTPLSALMGLAESMAMTPPALSTEQQVMAQSIQEEAQRMNALINNLLDMARLQSGSVQLNRQWQLLEEVVGSALQAAQRVLVAHPVSVHLPEDLPLLEFDAVLMERVFFNLLENAAKYTPAGCAISIGAQVQGDMAHIWVDDDGPGLPQGPEDNLFEKFERGQKESTTPGVGLGLAICRAIVQAHGGQIRAQRRAQGGARFIFTLPLGTPPRVISIEEVDHG
jgi:two-component system sensor histidine kinase KdpD